MCVSVREYAKSMQLLQMQPIFPLESLKRNITEAEKSPFVLRDGKDRRHLELIDFLFDIKG